MTNDKENAVTQPAAQEPAKRKLGRPPKDPAELRTELLRVFWSPAEKLKLNQDAAACGMGPAEYVRQLVAGHRPRRKADDSADPRLLNELNAIGNNLNQTVGLVRHHPQARDKWQRLHRLNELALERIALADVPVSQKLLMRLNYLGTKLNRAVKDRHAGSTRNHDWRDIYLLLQNAYQEILTHHVH